MPYAITTGETPRAYLERVVRLTGVTEGDGISAAALSNEYIINNTVAGVDYQGNAFTPYSTRSPYYHTPTSSGESRKYRMATALHFSRYYGGDRKRGGISVRYDNYAAYVLAVRGSSVVDLGGKEGRVLNAIEARCGSITSTGADAVNWPLDSNMEPAQEYTQGIYQEPNASIAAAHNFGDGHVPQREFFNESDQTTERITEHIAGRIRQRVIEINTPH